MSSKQSSGTSNDSSQNQSAEYWEKVLTQNKLSMGRGIVRQLSYVGTSNYLAELEERDLWAHEGQHSCVLHGIKIRKGGRRIFSKIESQ